MSRDSLRVDQARVDTFAADPNNPFLVSFPRTGSHWLRMLMELCFERPTLVRNFYFPERDDFLILHTHDDDLMLERAHVLYLWRQPVDTVFSQLRYHEESTDRLGAMRGAERYGQHLHKWLCSERFTETKTVVTYEALRADVARPMAEVAAFLGLPLDTERLRVARERVTHDEVHSKTRHDPQVVATRTHYATARDAFRRQWSALVRDTLLEGRPELEPVLTEVTL